MRINTSPTRINKGRCWSGRRRRWFQVSRTSALKLESPAVLLVLPDEEVEVMSVMPYCQVKDHSGRRQHASDKTQPLQSSLPTSRPRQGRAK
jgi:hypothetical protein